MKTSGHILTTMVCMLVSVVSIAQTTDTLQLNHIEKCYNIFFPINSSTVETNFQNNSQTIQAISQEQETTFGCDSTAQASAGSILIISSSSPDGSLQLNSDLAKRRAESTGKLIQELFPELSTSYISIEYKEENWHGLHQILIAEPDFPQRKEMLAIIESSQSADDKEKSLRGCTEGWKHFIDHHIHTLRNSSIIFTALEPKDEIATDQTLDSIETVSHTPPMETPQPGITSDLPVINYPKKKKVAAVRTNLLSPLSNIGAEVCLSDRWSLEGDYYFPWLSRKEDHQNAMQLLVWGVTGRYWFGKDRESQDRLLGHSVGLGTYIGYYDLEHNYTGHQGEFASLCLDYMYATPVFKKKMHLEFTLGVGYLYSYARPYDVFESGGKAFREGYAKNIQWIGPLKAGVSLVVPIHARRK